ncbi:MAG TPA: hypothetical protein ENN07_02515 [candidate division Zixibacteria bacterium]|nr:hypothetical protein [candidate division Zixibacteria bacterium]
MKRAILIIALISAFAGAWTFHGAFFLDGPIMPSGSATAGMGGLRVLPPDEPSSALWAPTAIPREGLVLSANVDLARMSENRALPLYDSFNNRAGWTIYASSAKTYPAIGAFASYGLVGDFMPSFVVGYSTVFDANYIYREQVRQREDPNIDALLGTWAIDSEGALSGPTFAIREDILHYGTVGVSATLLSGEISMRRSAPADESAVHNAEPWEAVFEADTSYSAELSGVMFSLSAVATPTDRWQIGLRFSPEVDLGESLYPDILPSRLGIGVGYRPPGYVVSRVVAEFEFVGYSTLADKDSAFAEMTDSWEFRVGLEHILPGNVPFRVGAYHYKIPLIDPVPRTGFTVGSAVSVGPARVDFFAGYQMSTFRHHPQFPESWLPRPFETANREDLDRIEESLFMGGLTIVLEL